MQKASTVWVREEVYGFLLAYRWELDDLFVNTLVNWYVRPILPRVLAFLVAFDESFHHLIMTDVETW